VTLRLDAVEAARAWCRTEREHGKTLGFVPTMGALHLGHLALVRRAVAENDHAVVSVFVNPLQFDDPADFERYPRDFDRDAERLSSVGCALVFTGTLAQFFPGELDERGRLAGDAYVDPGPCAEGLEGAFRSGHFQGVATIVARLFDVVGPTRAYFGEKDFQQLCVVRDLARRRGGPTVVPCPIEREASGLARSSRNELLTPDERRRAAALYAGLARARSAWTEGERDVGVLAQLVREAAEPAGLELEYVAFRDPEDWGRGPLGDGDAASERAIALVAARIGGVRLIDNLRLDGVSS